MSKKKDNYWTKRKAERMVAEMEKAEDFSKKLNTIYDMSKRQIQSQIDNIFHRYQTDYGLTELEARRILSNVKKLDDMREIRAALTSMSDPQEIEQTLATLDSASYASRIAHFERLQVEVGKLQGQLFQNENKRSTAFYKDFAEDAYYHSIYDLHQLAGVAFDFGTISQKDLIQVVSQPWLGSHYSRRIWANTGQLASELQKELAVSLLTGRSSFATAEVIDERFNKGKNNARRLVRTESAHLHAEMEGKAYEEADVERYRFLATLDMRTSSICREHDGKVYQVSERQTGINYPPLHPWCRSDTIALDDDEWLASATRSARDPKTGKTIQVPADMAYDDWYAEYVERKPYKSVKDKWLTNVDPTEAKVTDRDFWVHDGKKYEVDGHNVVLDYSQKEKETAEWLSQMFGKHVEMVPRVNNPKGINTPDYLIDGMKFDLKEISGTGNNVIDTASKKAKKQAENIVFDITKTSLTEAEIISRIENIYISGRRGLNIALLKKSDELIDIFEPIKKE